MTSRLVPTEAHITTATTELQRIMRDGEASNIFDALTRYEAQCGRTMTNIIMRGHFDPAELVELAQYITAAGSVVLADYEIRRAMGATS